jgi:hypothetical protein
MDNQLSVIIIYRKINNMNRYSTRHKSNSRIFQKSTKYSDGQDLVKGGDSIEFRSGEMVFDFYRRI